MDMLLIADLGSTLAIALNILKILIGLGFVIFVHELGHFLVAKACGVKCEKFYVGFDVPIKIGPIRLPASLCRFQWGETEYGIGIVPLGGYVKMLGQDDNPGNAEEEQQRIMVKKDSADGEEDEYVLDPRSFPAKSVPQRMAIISAGVIMNLIFAVLFAGVAYRLGVRHMVCEVGGTAPGSPAWEKGLQPYDKIVRIGKSGEDSEHVRFGRDLITRVSLNRRGLPMQFHIRRAGTDTTEWIELQPRLVAEKKFQIGLAPLTSNKLGGMPTISTMSASESVPAFAGGDVITHINGMEVGDGRAIGKQLLDAFNETVKVTVERTILDEDEEPTEETETVEIEVPPNALKLTGMTMKMGPIRSIRTGSPAETAGIQVGDLLKTIDGQSIDDPLLLNHVTLPMVGREVEVVVSRSGEDKTLNITPVKPDAITPSGSGSQFGMGTFGVAFDVDPTVVGVAQDGPAAKAGIQPGDEIVEVSFETTDEETLESLKQLHKNFDEPIDLTSEFTKWQNIDGMIQLLWTDKIQLKLKVIRNEKEQIVTLTPVRSNEYFQSTRGFATMLKTDVHTAKSWGEAIKLGFRQTQDRFIDVLSTLELLFSGWASVTELSGPVGIIQIASAEASAGIPHLLMFLTFLSANLAIVNFLPIPALDGGHMMFLAWEGIVGKPVNENVQIRLTVIGVLFLLGVIFIATVSDIGRFFWT